MIFLLSLYDSNLATQCKMTSDKKPDVDLSRFNHSRESRYVDGCDVACTLITSLDYFRNDSGRGRRENLVDVMSIALNCN